MARNLAIEQLAEKANPIFICPKTISMGGNRQHQVHYLDYKKHNEEECIYRDLVCPICKIKVPRREFEAHFQSEHAEKTFSVGRWDIDKPFTIYFNTTGTLGDDERYSWDPIVFEVDSTDGEVLAHFLCFAMMEQGNFTICFYRFDFTKSGIGDKFKSNEIYAECGKSLHKVSWIWLPDNGVCKPSHWRSWINRSTPAETERPSLPGFSCYPVPGMVNNRIDITLSVESPW